MAHILVVDDEKSICELLEITFRKEGHRVEVANSGEAARRRMESQIFDIIISDIRMPNSTGVDLLKFSKEIAPSSVFLLITGVPTVETAIAAINFGADRYVIKDHQLVDQLRRAVQQVAENLKWKTEAGYLRRELRRLTGLDNIIGRSPKMRAIFDLIQTVAPQSSRVLITGESGTGKELVARAIHENSPRAQAPFITINCGAFPETLLESELFGYMKGAFTGANENRQGLFRAAHGGTLFMDEIGNMTQTMQVKLYRVLQEGKVRPLGILGTFSHQHGETRGRHRTGGHALPGIIRLAGECSRAGEYHRAFGRPGDRPSHLGWRPAGQGQWPPFRNPRGGGGQRRRHGVSGRRN